MSREITGVVPAVIASIVDGGYPSPTTVERAWSDGTLDFACAAKACGFTAAGDSAVRVISSHYRMAHTRETERHFPDVPFRDQRYRRPGQKLSVTANTASNAEIVRAIRQLVEAGTDDAELAEFKSLLAMAETEREAALSAQREAERALVLCKSELRELQTWRASFRSFVNGNGNTPH